MIMESMILFYLLLFLVAFLYSSVGHGGASGYLALMAIFNFAPEVMKPTALLLNLFVSLVAFIQFYRGGHFNLKLFLPFALTSVPFSFIGGLILIDSNLYKHILGFLLLIPIARFLFLRKIDATRLKPSNMILSLLIGGIIGFLSGLIGIGGGILLSPIVLLLRWADQKQTAAISALFIFVNSLSGLIGQLVMGIKFSSEMYGYVSIAFIGGICGAYFGALRFKQFLLRYLLVVVLLIAVWKLMFTNA
jgi:uncharacterized protein